MVAGTRQEPRWMRTEAVWKPAIGPSLEVELYISPTYAKAGPELFPLPPGGQPASQFRLRESNAHDT